LVHEEGIFGPKNGLWSLKDGPNGGRGQNLAKGGTKKMRRMGKRKRRAFLANGLWRERNAIRRLEKHGKLE
jgi:hypothetical protein